ncbi:eukaryotic translation initiation factor 3 subunit B-like [Tubulanus polymorphus]|uniref:eukaryotic translation initiation factor 3 subunit B-like n=1 Tax=Tubulanus polymorphus TaxID=672921 RepID=UPI003DA4AC12
MAADDSATYGRNKMLNKSFTDDYADENGCDSDIDIDMDFSDPDDFIDDVTDEELLGDLLKSKPKETDGIDSVIVVDNIPKVGSDRKDKLKNVIRKIYQQFGKLVTEHYPEENGMTKGYIFLEYTNPAHAQEAVTKTNGYKLDKAHTFSVNLFSDFDRYANVPDEWEKPEPMPYKDHGNLRQWLQNSDCHDQYSIIYDGGERTAIFANGNNAEPLSVEERARWTETYVRWSPMGTYLATFHSKGIALWGGEKFRQIMRFSHNGVQLIDFSSCERYMVTFSPIPDTKSDESRAVIIWDILTGLQKRSFHCENASVWPIFKWSPDGKYFARIGTDTLSIYETPSFGLLDKKSLKITGIADFSWSPTDNIICYCTPEENNTPARVTLLEIPSRRELCVKNLFNVADLKMHWQKNGDYLCCKVDRYSKMKKEKDQIKYSGMYHNFEIFRMREKQIPVDKVEMKEPIIAFAWEPTGHKFSFIHGESTRISVSFYQVRPAGRVDLIKTFEKRQVNHIFWSPMGQFVVLAGLRSMSGSLEFIDTNDMTIMNMNEHFMATDVEWDPTGRYVASAVSWWGHKVDNAYWIWNFQGRLLQKQPLERFCQLLWRPRPPSLLTDAMIKEIKKNMKKYSAQFEVKDRMSQTKASKELIERRQKKVDEFLKYREQVMAEYQEQKPQRMALRGGIDTDDISNDTENFTEETIEFLVKVEETIEE